jgi:hypothetical protein
MWSMVIKWQHLIYAEDVTKVNEQTRVKKTLFTPLHYDLLTVTNY